MNIELAVVMPVYNEEANIGTVVSEWVAEFNRLGIGFVLLAVNDGSRDNTGAVLANLAGRLPESIAPINQANSGHGRACRRGYERAVEINAPWTFQIDSDGQCDPKFFEAFWRAREEADAVFGLRKTRDDGFSRVLISTACWITASALCGMNLKDANVPYRLIRTTTLARALDRIPAGFDMQNVGLTLALRRDASVRWKYLPIHFRDRQGGTNSINIPRILSMGWELLCGLKQIRK
jgi:glycosyltransferase involved in cell wall biosynthesis